VKPLKLKVETDTKSIEEMVLMFHELYDRCRVLLNNQEDLDKVVVLDTPWAGRRETSLSEMVMHIVTHGSYHRGNITAMLRQMGHASVTTDLTSFWYADRA
jgi:uncharacterized damage-inducible protein DinB